MAKKICMVCKGIGFHKGKVCICISDPMAEPLPGEDLFEFIKRMGKKGQGV